MTTVEINKSTTSRTKFYKNYVTPPNLKKQHICQLTQSAGYSAPNSSTLAKAKFALS